MTQKLGIKHLRQVQAYAVNEGVEWMVLTNGQVWQVWHLTGGLPVAVDLALEVDLLSDMTVIQKADASTHGHGYLSATNRKPSENQRVRGRVKAFVTMRQLGRRDTTFAQ